MTRDNNKRAVDHAADLLFYAPIGLFFEAPALMAKLAEQGRTHARNARLFGKFAVEQGEARVRERMSTVEEQATGVLRLLGVLPTPPSEPPPAPGPTPVPEPVVESATAAPAATELAIPDYDSLSASQVVTRLPGLAPDELERVRVYEAAHRGRKTILNRIAQLQT